MKKQHEDHGYKYAIYLFGLLLLVMVVVIAMRSAPAKVKQVYVEYVDSARQEAYDRGFDDAQFIRRSGIMDREIKEIEKWRSGAAEGIAGSGFFRLDDVRVSGKQKVTLVISARSPLITVSTGGKYVVLDKECYVLKISDKRSSQDPILVNGVLLLYLETGRQANAEDAQRLAQALEIAEAIYQNGYKGVFTDITMQDQKFVMLNTAAGVPVTINLRYPVLTSLDIAKAILDTGVSGGKIVVADKYGDYIQDDNTTTYSRGM